MKSALFVDFDNVFSLLRQLQPSAAEQFARHPDVWIHWLTHSFAMPEPHAEGERRRLLVRRCYLNPNWYQVYRHAFLRAGFEIVDCPPVTSQGKTSTDIHLVLDAVDLLQHGTHYDEFIVFSADADFTPLLRKLRRHDRRTTVLAIGFPSAAYQASADLLIPERLFVGEALYPAQANVDSGPLTGHEQKGSDRVLNDRPSPALVGPPASAPTTSQAPTAPRSARPATASELSEIANRIWQTVDESVSPVNGGPLASRLKAEFPEALENWNGSGGFRPFLTSLNLARLVWLGGSGGRLLDPARHEVEGRSTQDEPDSPWGGEGEIFPVVKEVCSLTKAPMLAPTELRQVLKALSTELAEGSFQPSTTAAQVCSRCLSSTGLRVRQRDVAFLIKGMQLNGHVFGQGQDDVVTLGSRLVDQVLFLCAREQLVLDEAEVAAVRLWVTGEGAPAKVPASD
ncbi:NYN domain-containing protein [Variovorax sp. YR216]|uniref:NYN domain-containing protein n=1 Tax=Variovorax sp. YR216 TaxID=1882828 RepID=UPI00089B2898|nr:NYN domain-containing protein [Variovorax sp. YR216]SEB22410.1 Uncharacterized conserved protein, LabA/DUF88 family [Variovorax sp. YR216]